MAGFGATLSFRRVAADRRLPPDATPGAGTKRQKAGTHIRVPCGKDLVGWVIPATPG
jgi:hypothetical protein